jgi:hypothetical protein
MLEKKMILPNAHFEKQNDRIPLEKWLLKVCHIALWYFTFIRFVISSSRRNRVTNAERFQLRWKNGRPMFEGRVLTRLVMAEQMRMSFWMSAYRLWLI